MAATDMQAGSEQRLYIPRLAFRNKLGAGFFAICLAGTLVGVVFLAFLLFDVWRDGAGFLRWEFLQNFPSRFPERAGFQSALWGSLWLIATTAIIAFPIGVGAAIYLEEYAPRNFVTKAIQTNISNLAGVPSIVFGILGLQLFVRGTIGIGPSIGGGFGRSIIAGGATMALLILPIVIVAAQESIRAVPPSLREASYGVGATRWQTVWHHVLPQAFPGIMTGTILALSRAIGETAPLIMIGALTFVAFRPESPLDPFTVMPIQIYNWVARPQPEFQDLAATGIIVLLVMLLSMNAIAVLLRQWTGRRYGR
ncbi:MAG: phosphate ABC transporter permease PstA [Chloroflexi bacterium]|nr:phosphate ABC transporter permease PstA [Chloroflexota bacterium]MYE45715.1 phosphate ABC transporter permease PstA [Chloroflexota bacterium]